jgi:hypothetical protein
LFFKLDQYQEILMFAPRLNPTGKRAALAHYVDVDVCLVVWGPLHQAQTQDTGFETEASEELRDK